MNLTTLIRWSTEVLALGVLLSILQQDWRWRGVYWYCFPLLTALLLGSRLTTHAWDAVLLDAALNVAFVGLQLLVLALYVRWRFAAPLQAYLGAGDMLYWLAVSVFFAPCTYVVYYLSSLLAALLAFTVLRHLLPARLDERIPLAGLQAGFLAGLLACSWFWAEVLPADDRWVLSYLG